MKKLGVILSIAILLPAYSAYAFAEQDPTSVSVSLKPKITIAVDTPNVGFGDMEPATSKELDAANGSYAVWVTVKSNEPWDYTYTATDFTGSDTFGVNHLSYKDDSASAYTDFSNSATLATGVTRGAKQYDYKLTFNDTDADWRIPSGNYSSTVTYSAVQ